jgi:hypothetical protein
VETSASWAQLTKDGDQGPTGPTGPAGVFSQSEKDEFYVMSTMGAY